MGGVGGNFARTCQLGVESAMGYIEVSLQIALIGHGSPIHRTATMAKIHGWGTSLHPSSLVVKGLVAAF